MTQPHSPPPCLPSWPSGSPAPAAAALAADRLLGTLQVATGLVQSGRPVDLAGLDHDVGALCAGVLDLPIVQGRQLAPALAGLLAAAQALDAAVAGAAG